MKFKIFCILVISTIFLWNCESNKTFTVNVKNNSNRLREAVSVTILLSKLPSKITKEVTSICFKNVRTGEILPGQFIDLNGDGQKDAILFRPTLAPNSEDNYKVLFSNEKCTTTNSIKTTYSRFVPERMDDYAWENDRVAFRVYGPKAQLLFEENRREGKNVGIISSGIDCWLKRVDYPIINKWYKKYTDNTGTYHEDTGEGLDDYHVGTSRGCGGIGVWDSTTKELYTSKNFTTWKTIDKGPLRTSFRLDYAPWKANGTTIKESKTISLDLGSSLSKYEIDLSGSDTIPQITVGLTLHDRLGVIKSNEAEGWFSYWETLGDSELGTGIVVNPKYIVGYEIYETVEKDKSHLFVHLKPINGKIVYYSGYGWTKSKYFSCEKDWDSYLANYAKDIKEPVEVKIN